MANGITRPLLSQLIPGMGVGYDQAVLPHSQVNLDDPVSMANANANTDAINSEAAGLPTGRSMTALSLGWWVVMFALLIGLMLLARFLGKGEGFSNLKLSAYNLLVISWVAILGIAFYKAVFARINVPFVSPLVAGV